MGKTSWGMRPCGVFLLWITAAIALPAQTFTTLHSLNYAEGAGPTVALIQSTDGNLYGTTSNGGANNSGVVFRITPQGTLTRLYSFCTEDNCTDGATPYAALVQASDGNLYGTTGYGGANNAGTVFKISPSGAHTVIYSFCSEPNCRDGWNASALVQGTDGDLYGATYWGGPNDGCYLGCGTVFRINLSGTLTTLHSFCSKGGCSDGSNPAAGLVQGADGNFYGTTVYGGSHGQFGTIFKITPSGTLTTLHSFDGSDGGDPGSPLVEGADGNFYGTVSGAGSKMYGTVYKITLGGTLTTLYSFCSQAGCRDGEEPLAGLLAAPDGNFYGTTYNGGAYNACYRGCGTIFKITPGGALTTLHDFCSQAGCADGDMPYGGLVQDTNGEFYGTANGGGTSGTCDGGCGTVFSLSAGLKPFVETQPTSGVVGAAVNILGTNLTGATSVTFDGTAAVFTVDSHSLITTTVPAGATSGKVEVTNATNTIRSNVPFHVLP